MGHFTRNISEKDMTLRPSIQIDAALRYCLEQQVSLEKPVCFFDVTLIRKMRLPGSFKLPKRKVKRLALPECHQH